MTSQNPEKSNVARRDFLRMPGAGLVADRPTRSANVETGSNYIAVHAEGAAAFMASGFAKHIGQLGVGVGTACIRHKSSARRPDFTVHGLC